MSTIQDFPFHRTARPWHFGAYQRWYPLLDKGSWDFTYPDSQRLPSLHRTTKSPSWRSCSPRTPGSNVHFTVTIKPVLNPSAYFYDRLDYLPLREHFVIVINVMFIYVLFHPCSMFYVLCLMFYVTCSMECSIYVMFPPCNGPVQVTNICCNPSPSHHYMISSEPYNPFDDSLVISTSSVLLCYSCSPTIQ